MGAIKSTVSSPAEDMFIQIFIESFGPEYADRLYLQYPVVDIYGRNRFIDFAIKTEEEKIAIEIDGETYHNPSKVSESKYADDLLKQNSLVFEDWKVYRWTYQQLNKQSEAVKDQLRTFLGSVKEFSEFADYLPEQKGKIIELRDYQKEAIESLQKMRGNGETIALLYHATGVGKTVTAATDAKKVGGKTLFLVNKLNLATQAEKTFEDIWPEATLGEYTGQQKVMNQQVTFATVQSMAKDYKEFEKEEFDYICIDECHHATSTTYQRLLSYFKPKFILGLSATPEREDGESLLELFQNVAHKMDLKTAVELGILASIRCLRVKTNVDLSDVRINNIRYNSQDLESKLFIPERNQLIVDTYLQYTKGMKSVVFCASVKHAEEVAALFEKQGVAAASISGRLKAKEQESVLSAYESGKINVLCACDLLNEGWDSPHTQVLFMARPTMSKTLYMQQLGRGTRKCEGKEELLVIDFVDNANMFNCPYSLHRTLDFGQYRPFDYVLKSKMGNSLDKDLTYKGERPEIVWDIPVDIQNFEEINLFNWQEETKNMISELEFVRMVNVQAETVRRYIREGKLKADLSVPIGESRVFHYFNKETVERYAKEYGWTLITNANIKEVFLEFIDKMDMSYSYKPVLLKAMIDHMDDQGRVLVEDIMDYFIDFYELRREQGLVVEKKKCIYLDPYDGSENMRKNIEKNIFSNPFKRFEDMGFFERCKNVEMVKVNSALYRKLSTVDWRNVIRRADSMIEEYYASRYIK